MIELKYLELCPKGTDELASFYFQL
jgi:hypothetical protein